VVVVVLVDASGAVHLDRILHRSSALLFGDTLLIFSGKCASFRCDRPFFLVMALLFDECRFFSFFGEAVLLATVVLQDVSLFSTVQG